MSNKKRMIAIGAAVVVVIAIIIIVLVLGGKKGEPKKEPAKEETNTHAGEAQSYLTGEWMDEEIVKTRPIAMMTENTKQTLPQYGISTAGVVYEAPVEGSYTRLMPIYDDLGTLEKVGNVRSSRLYYLYFAAEFDAVYVHFGQAANVVAYLERGVVNNLSGLDGSVSSAVFYRTSDRKAPHNAYTSAEGIKQGIEKKQYRKEHDADYTGHYQFAEDDKPVTLKNGTDVAVVKPYYFYNHPYFIYNDKDRLYYRYQFGEKQVDGNNDEQLSYRNIIFQNVEYSIYEGTEYLNIPLTGGGAGKYFTNGKMIDITWKKDQEWGITHYYDADGKEITLNQGKTWVCIIQNPYADKSEFYATEKEFTDAGTN